MSRLAAHEKALPAKNSMFLFIGSCVASVTLWVTARNFFKWNGFANGLMRLCSGLVFTAGYIFSVYYASRLEMFTLHEMLMSCGAYCLVMCILLGGPRPKEVDVGMSDIRVTLESSKPVVAMVIEKDVFLGQCFRWRDEGDEELFCTATHVISGADQNQLSLITSKKAIKITSAEIPFPQTYPDFAIIRAPSGTGSALGLTKADVSYLTSGFASGTVTAICPSVMKQTRSQGPVRRNKHSADVYDYSGSTKPGWSGAPLSVGGKIVGMHCCTVNGKVNSGYFMQAVLALYEHKRLAKYEDSYDQMFQDFQNNFDRFTVELDFDDEDGRVTYGFRHRSGKTQWVDQEDVPAGLLEMVEERSRRERYSDRSEWVSETGGFYRASDARKAQEAEEDRRSRQMPNDWKSSKGKTWSRAMEEDEEEIDYTEQLEFERVRAEKFPDAEDINFEHLETAFRCTETYTETVAELANMAMTIQTLMLENRADIEATSQLGQDLSYINAHILQTAASGRKITAVVEDQTFLNERELAEKKRTERARARKKEKPPVGHDTAITVERLMTKIKAAVDQAEKIPKRKVRVPNVVVEKATEWQDRMFATYSKAQKKTPLPEKGAQSSSLSPPTERTLETSQKKERTKSKSAPNSLSKPSPSTKITRGQTTPRMESTIPGSSIVLGEEQPVSLVSPPQGKKFEDASRAVAETLTPLRTLSNTDELAEKLATQMGTSLETFQTLKPLSAKCLRQWRDLSKT